MCYNAKYNFMTICKENLMIKSEIAEIRKQFTHDNCAITKICGCYVDGEKNKRTKLSGSFLSLPEEETFKYFEIFKKTLSGTIGKNLIDMEFPTSEEFEGGTQEFILKLRDSQLNDEGLVDEFFDKVIQLYDTVDNYLILVVYASYDVPGKGNDKRLMEDASDEVYNFILSSICPVKLSKPGLSYDSSNNIFQNRIQDWVVSPPSNGFLFPAFNDRGADIHSILYYSKDSEELRDNFVNEFLGCLVPLSAGDQKRTFQDIIEKTLGEECEYEIVRDIHENLNRIIEEKKEDPQPFVLDKREVKNLFIESGTPEEKLQEFDQYYEKLEEVDVSLIAANVINTRVFEVNTPEVSIKVSPEYAGLIETKMVDGKKCLVIAIDDNVEVNGIRVNVSKA